MPYKDKAKQRESAARHYQKNKDEIKKRAGTWRDKNRREVKAYVDEIKESNPCLDCEVNYPSYVMEFDHVTEDKEQCISVMVASGVTLPRIKAEIEKCELVCANCHRERTFSRLYNQSSVA